MHEYSEALKYFVEALRICEGLGERNIVTLAALYFSVGKCKFNIEDYEPALGCFIKVRKFYETLYPTPHDMNHCRINYSIAETHRLLGELDQA
mmetsp:Transcript_2720/g.2370  ORF Transcript_2720/g.2370 Transcript_2720/m.2370 type:complete len:93 (+) Transcript_2720:1709-1987(+)